MCILYESEMLSEVNTFILFIYYIKKKKFFYHKLNQIHLTCHQLTCGSLNCVNSQLELVYCT